MPITSLTSYFNTSFFGDTNTYTRNQQELALTLDSAAHELANWKSLLAMSAGGGAFEGGRLLASTFLSSVPVLSAIPLLTKAVTFFAGALADTSLTRLINQAFGNAGEEESFFDQITSQGSVRLMGLVGMGQSFAVMQLLQGFASVSRGMICEENLKNKNSGFLHHLILGLQCHFGSGMFAGLTGGIVAAVEQRMSLRTKNVVVGTGRDLSLRVAPTNGTGWGRAQQAAPLQNFGSPVAAGLGIFPPASISEVKPSGQKISQMSGMGEVSSGAIPSLSERQTLYRTFITEGANKILTHMRKGLDRGIAISPLGLRDMAQEVIKTLVEGDLSGEGASALAELRGKEILLVVQGKENLERWRDRLEECLDQKRVGGHREKEVWEKNGVRIRLASIHTLSKLPQSELKAAMDRSGLVILDKEHHVRPVLDRGDAERERFARVLVEGGFLTEDFQLRRNPGRFLLGLTESVTEGAGRIYGGREGVILGEHFPSLLARGFINNPQVFALQARVEKGIPKPWGEIDPSERLTTILGAIDALTAQAGESGKLPRIVVYAGSREEAMALSRALEREAKYRGKTALMMSGDGEVERQRREEGQDFFAGIRRIGIHVETMVEGVEEFQNHPMDYVIYAGVGRSSGLRYALQSVGAHLGPGEKVPQMFDLCEMFEAHPDLAAFNPLPFAIEEGRIRRGAPLETKGGSRPLGEQSWDQLEVVRREFFEASLITALPQTNRDRVVHALREGLVSYGERETASLDIDLKLSVDTGVEVQTRVIPKNVIQAVLEGRFLEQRFAPLAQVLVDDLEGREPSLAQNIVQAMNEQHGGRLNWDKRLKAFFSMTWEEVESLNPELASLLLEDKPIYLVGSTALTLRPNGIITGTLSLSPTKPAPESCIPFVELQVQGEEIYVTYRKGTHSELLPKILRRAGLVSWSLDYAEKYDLTVLEERLEKCRDLRAIEALGKEDPSFLFKLAWEKWGDQIPGTFYLVGSNGQAFSREGKVGGRLCLSQIKPVAERKLRGWYLLPYVEIQVQGEEIYITDHAGVGPLSLAESLKKGGMAKWSERYAEEHDLSPLQKRKLRECKKLDDIEVLGKEDPEFLTKLAQEKWGDEIPETFYLVGSSDSIEADGSIKGYLFLSDKPPRTRSSGKGYVASFVEFQIQGEEIYITHSGGTYPLLLSSALKRCGLVAWSEDYREKYDVKPLEQQWRECASLDAVEALGKKDPQFLFKLAEEKWGAEVPEVFYLVGHSSSTLKSSGKISGYFFLSENKPEQGSAIAFAELKRQGEELYVTDENTRGGAFFPKALQRGGLAKWSYQYSLWACGTFEDLKALEREHPQFLFKLATEKWKDKVPEKFYLVGKSTATFRKTDKINGRILLSEKKPSQEEVPFVELWFYRDKFCISGRGGHSIKEFLKVLKEMGIEDVSPVITCS